jgi:hypothetical protein
MAMVSSELPLVASQTILAGGQPQEGSGGDTDLSNTVIYQWYLFFQNLYSSALSRSIERPLVLNRYLKYEKMGGGAFADVFKVFDCCTRGWLALIVGRDLDEEECSFMKKE